MIFAIAQTNELDSIKTDTNSPASLSDSSYYVISQQTPELSPGIMELRSPSIHSDIMIICIGISKNI